MARSAEKTAKIVAAKNALAPALAKIRSAEAYVQEMRRTAAPLIAELCVAAEQNGPFNFVLAEGAETEKLTFRRIPKSAPPLYAIDRYEPRTVEEL